jgi:predicted nuclease of predicted toxin-antitoxin system
MRVLLDECVPRKLRRELPGHDVKTLAEMGWSGTKNNALLRLAAAQFDVLLTVDQGIPYQQNLPGLDLALVIVRAPNNDINDLRPKMPEVLRVLEVIQPGQVVHVGA